MNDYLDLAGQLVMVRLFGTELDAETDAFLRTYRIRGACLFRQNMLDAPQLTRFTGALRDAIGPQALIALDQEGGAEPPQACDEIPEAPGPAERGGGPQRPRRP